MRNIRASSHRFGRRLLFLFVAHAAIYSQYQRTLAGEEKTDNQSQAAPTDVPETNKFIDRLVYLFDQLVSVEARIGVIDEAIRKAAHKSASAGRTASSFEKNNERMDRHAGGPKPWKEFYGEVAKDFYMPGGMLTGPKKVERPAQFDYLYRANQKHIDRARQDVASWGSNVKELMAYRGNLEKERSALWAVITLEQIQNKAIPQRSLYHWRLVEQSKASSENADDSPRVAVLRSAVLVLRTIDITAAEGITRLSSGKAGVNDQGKVYLVLRQTIKDARAPAEEAAIHYRDTEGESSENGQRMVALLSHYTRLDSAAANTCDAYRRAIEIDVEKEKQNAEEQRLKLQQSLINVAGETIKLDQTITEFAQVWEIGGQAGTAYPDVIADPYRARPSATVSASPATQAPRSSTETMSIEEDPLNDLREIRIHAGNAVEVIRVAHEGGNAKGISQDGQKSGMRRDGDWIRWRKYNWNWKTKVNARGQKIEFIYGP